MDAEPQTWHHGLVATWWAEFNQGGEEVDYFRGWIERSGQPALDVACGTGRLLVPYRQAGLDIDGCDVSPDMVAACRRKLAEAGVDANVWVAAMDELAAEEEHLLTITLYFRDELLAMLERAGFRDVQVFAGNSERPPTRDDDFLVFAARR